MAKARGSPDLMEDSKVVMDCRICKRRGFNNDGGGYKPGCTVCDNLGYTVKVRDSAPLTPKAMWVSKGVGAPLQSSLKYPSMTGPDPMYRAKDSDPMSPGGPYEECGARVGCNCQICESYRGKSKQEEVKNMDQTLYVFNMVAVDRQECEVVKTATVIGTEADKGIVELDLDSAQKKMLKKGRLAIFRQQQGTFERYVPEVELPKFLEGKE